MEGRLSEQLLRAVKRPLVSALVLHWRQKAQARAQVRLAIEDELDRGLPRAFTPEIYREKCARLFEHVYEMYYGEGRSAFGSAVA